MQRKNMKKIYSVEKAAFENPKQLSLFLKQICILNML